MTSTLLTLHYPPLAHRGGFSPIVVSAFTDIYDFASKIREGSLTWEEMDPNDVDIRLKVSIGRGSEGGTERGRQLEL